MSWMFLAAIILAILFDILNGYNDGGSIIGTLVSAPFMSPLRIVLFVCFFELCGMGLIYYLGMRIAHSLTGLSLNPVTPAIILAALTAAVIWKIATIIIGIPTSSAHALVGGLTGAIIIAQGLAGVSQAILGKIVIILLITPVISLLLGYFMMQLALLALQRATPQINTILVRLQLVTVAATSTIHGATEPQKTIAILILTLVTFGYQKDFNIPVWVVIISVAMISLGILAGGWRIARTFNRRLLKIRPIDSVITQISTGIVILVSALWGGTFSTSQIVGSSLVGAGMAQHYKQVSWNVARNILMAWLVTIPATAVCAMIIWKILVLTIPLTKGGLWV